MDPFSKILELLQSHRVKFEKIEHEPVYTSEQAAAVRGISLESGAKSLLLKAKGGFVLVVVPGSKRIDSKKIKKILQVKDIRFASPEEVKEQMGCEVGSCYPLGNVAGLRTLVDTSLSQNDTISFNPGRHDTSIKMRYADYQRIADPEVVEVIS